MTEPKPGILGYIFGTTDNTATYTASIVLILLVSFGGYLYIIDSPRIEGYIAFAAPIITGIVGYLFGQKKVV